MIENFIYVNENLERPCLELPVVIPYMGSVPELAAIFLSNNKIPEYLKEGTSTTIYSYYVLLIVIFPEFTIELEKFINESTEKFYDERSQKLIDDAKTGQIDIEEQIRKWEKKYKEVLLIIL